jgi:hypothetical protein
MFQQKLSFKNRSIFLKRTVFKGIRNSIYEGEDEENAKVCYRVNQLLSEDVAYFKNVEVPNHRNLLAYMGVVEEKEYTFFIMECVGTNNLADLIADQKKKSLPFQENVLFYFFILFYFFFFFNLFGCRL